MSINGEINDETLSKFLQGVQGVEPGFHDVNDSGNRIVITLSSPGGDVDVGMSIYELLRTADAEIVIHGYGIVGSIAVLIFMGADKRVLTPGTRFFVHPGSAAAAFPENIFSVNAKSAELMFLHRWYCEQLAARSGTDVNTVSYMCDRDTFLSAHDALKFGFATHLDLYTQE
jgi:ATP-dependent Clp protease protease subunit